MVLKLYDVIFRQENANSLHCLPLEVVVVLQMLYMRREWTKSWVLETKAGEVNPFASRYSWVGDGVVP